MCVKEQLKFSGCIVFIDWLPSPIVWNNGFGREVKLSCSFLSLISLNAAQREVKLSCSFLSLISLNAAHSPSQTLLLPHRHTHSTNKACIATKLLYIYLLCFKLWIQQQIFTVVYRQITDHQVCWSVTQYTPVHWS